MARQPEPVRLGVEEADNDALAAATIQAIVAVLVKEAVTQANEPRVKRLRAINEAAEAIRLRAIDRKKPR